MSPLTDEAYEDPEPCEVCGDMLTETRLFPGIIWTPSALAHYGRQRFGRVLCLQHFREQAEQARKSAIAPGVFQ